MKTLNVLCLLAIGLLIVSCDGSKKLTPEEEVRNYGKYFVEKLAANQLDSLKASYPDIAKADSIIPIKSDTIMLAEVVPGQYDMTLAEGITLKVRRSEDGNISVIESKGLFGFPADKVDIAKKTGMWDDKLSDTQLNERMKDEEFFKWIKKAKTVNTSDILSIKGKPGEYGTKGQYIQNNTDQNINASDYEVVSEEGGYSIDIGAPWRNKGVLKGKPIPPHGRVYYDTYDEGYSYDKITGIKLKLTSEQLQEKFTPAFTGNEYQEYLDSKK